MGTLQRDKLYGTGLAACNNARAFLPRLKRSREQKLVISKISTKDAVESSGRISRVLSREIRAEISAASAIRGPLP